MKLSLKGDTEGRSQKGCWRDENRSSIATCGNGPRLTSDHRPHRTSCWAGSPGLLCVGRTPGGGKSFSEGTVGVADSHLSPISEADLHVSDPGPMWAGTGWGSTATTAGWSLVSPDFQQFKYLGI